MKLPLFFRKVSSADQINFAKNLSVFLDGGISINEAVNILATQAKPGAMKDILYRIKGNLEKGVSLNGAIEAEGDIFEKVFVVLIKAGEMSGSLSSNLEFLSSWLERDSNLRREVNSVLLYPKIVLSAIVLLGGGLAVFILPKLVPMFTGLHVELPLMTRIVLGISLFLQSYWLYVIFGIFFIFILGSLIYRIKPVKYLFHKFYVRAPFISELIVGYQMALFSQLMGTLFKSGISIDEALPVALVGTNNLYYKKALGEIIDKTNQGVSLVETMKNYPDLYPVNTTSVLSVGENTGTLEQSFFKLSDFWSKEIIAKTKNLPAIIEPALLVLIAIGVGFIALSIIMPIYKLTGSLNIQ